MSPQKNLASTKKGNAIMNVQKEPTARLGQQAAGKNHSQNRTYRKPAPLSRSNLKENLGLLLCHLQSPLTKKQRRIGWRLVEVLLTQYVSERPRAAGIEKVGAVRLNGQG